LHHTSIRHKRRSNNAIYSSAKGWLADYAYRALGHA
jgi:hypothetical protein